MEFELIIERTSIRTALDRVDQTDRVTTPTRAVSAAAYRMLHASG